MNDNNVSINLNRFGFYVSLSTAILTIITFTIAFLTPPLSGPFCQGSCFEYPYSDIASRFPRDYYWMFPAMILTILFVIFILCIHSSAPENKKIYSKIGVSLSLMSATTILICYFIQVSVIQPSLLNNEIDGIALWSQYNPHGLFIALEELGYILMNLSFLFLAFVYSSKSKAENSIRWILFIGFILAIATFIFISMSYGINREYRYEIVIISIDWLTLIIAGILQSRIYWKAWKLKQ